MQKNSGAVVRIENWMVANKTERGVEKSALHGPKRPVRKIATRIAKGKTGAGQFVGSTNYRGTVYNGLVK